MRIAIVGPPNSGKSTVFNVVAGYKSVSSNFPGTTVRYTESKVRLNGAESEIVDFPGSYSLSSMNEIDLEIRGYLISKHIDAIINVVDASQLGRGLTLTLELTELNVPVVLCLNMMDEAERKGLFFNIGLLSDLLGIPVVPTIASKNIGIKELFVATEKISHNPIPATKKQLLCQKDVEEIISKLTGMINGWTDTNMNVTPRFIAIKLLEEDKQFVNQSCFQLPESLMVEAKTLQKQLAEQRGTPSDTVIAMERSALAMQIFKKVAAIGSPKKDWRDALDDILLHKVWGYIFMVLALVGMFYFVFGIGSFIETPLLAAFQQLESFIGSKLGAGILFSLAKSALYGISGGVAIVLPYLIPFLFALSILEDVGYLPRVAYLMDSFMHRIGLHGTAILPVVLGYGCSVPAVMATRILPARRDKIIAAAIATLIPCSARSVVILGLVAFYLGVPAALSVYVLNVVIIAVTGKVLSSLMPEVSPGMIMEMPRYRWPTLSAVFKKIWFRVREFVIIAWPLLVVGSMLLGIAEYFKWDDILNYIFSPMTMLLGLPIAVGTTLVFGILRKELSLIMLMQAIGTTDVLTVLTPGQIMVFTIFVTFYIPCVATIAILLNEFGMRWTLVVSGITLFLAVTLALLTRVGFLLLI